MVASWHDLHTHALSMGHCERRKEEEKCIEKAMEALPEELSGQGERVKQH